MGSSHPTLVKIRPAKSIARGAQDRSSRMFFSYTCLLAGLALVHGQGQQQQQQFIDSLRGQGFTDDNIRAFFASQQNQQQNRQPAQQNFQQQQQQPPQQQNFGQPPQQQQQNFQQQQGFQQGQQQQQQQQGFRQQQQGLPPAFQQPQQPQQARPQQVRQQAPAPQAPQAQQPPQRSQMGFRVSVDNEDYGQINMELFDEVVPRTARNLYSIASGQNQNGFTYTNSIFHRIIPQFMLQGGDFENFLVKHGSPGLLSMANSGPDTNGAQFFITTVKTDWLDGKHVVFGRIDDQESFNIVKRIELLGQSSGKPSKRVSITQSGVLATGCCCTQ